MGPDRCTWGHTHRANQDLLVLEKWPEMWQMLALPSGDESDCTKWQMRCSKTQTNKQRSLSLSTMLGQHRALPSPAPEVILFRSLPHGLEISEAACGKGKWEVRTWPFTRPPRDGG